MYLSKEMIIEELKNQNLNYGEYEITLIVDYLINLYEMNLLPENITYKDLITKLKEHNVKIVFFKDDDAIAKKYGDKFKGKNENDNNGNIVLYVRDSLKDKEIYFYHELTHLFQTKNIRDYYNDNLITGLSESNRNLEMVNEVITQYLSEKIYNKKYNKTSNVTLYKSEELRMKPGYKIYSELHNYQMYDYVVSLLLKTINISKDDLITEVFRGRSFKDIIDNNVMIDDDNITVIEVYLNYIMAVDLFIYTDVDIAKKLMNGENQDSEYGGYLYTDDNALNWQQQYNCYVYLCEKLKNIIEENKRQEEIKKK